MAAMACSMTTCMGSALLGSTGGTASTVCEKYDESYVQRRWDGDKKTYEGYRSEDQRASHPPP